MCDEPRTIRFPNCNCTLTLVFALTYRASRSEMQTPAFDDQSPFFGGRKAARSEPLLWPLKGVHRGLWQTRSGSGSQESSVLSSNERRMVTRGVAYDRTADAWAAEAIQHLYSGMATAKVRMHELENATESRGPRYGCAAMRLRVKSLIQN